jgi:hypothetical protein
MFAYACRPIVAATLLVALCLAQQESGTPSFHAQTDLVTISFQVRRGSRPVSDLKPSDVVLLEDGIPRTFTVFEAPSEHLTLDLVLMFDVTKPASERGARRLWFWDDKSLREMAGYWNEALVRRLLEGHGTEIRFSVYRFDQSKLQRLCQSTSDPKVLLDALHRLADSQAGQFSGQDAVIPLPANLAIRARARLAIASGTAPQPWSLAGALGVLDDSATGSPEKKPTARALVIFSTGAEGTSVTPGDVADRAADAGVVVYPVALFAFPPILPYDGYTYDGLFFYGDRYTGQSMWGPSGPYLPIWGPADRPNLPPNSPPVARYVNYPFETLGGLTGGLHFESVNHSTPLGESGERFVADHETVLSFSMTGAEIDDILTRIQNHALARFRSTYTVGFTPPPSGAPREHKLEVALAAKSTGKVTEGARVARY